MPNSRPTNNLSSLSKQEKPFMYVQPFQLHSWSFSIRDGDQVVTFATAPPNPQFTSPINNRDNIASYHQSQLPVPTLLPTTTTKPFHVADPHFWIAILLRLQLTNNSSIQNNQQSSPCPRKRPPSVPPRPKPRRRRRVSLPQQFTFTCAMFTDFFQIPTRLSVASPRTCSSPMSSVRTSVMRTLASASV